MKLRRAIFLLFLAILPLTAQVNVPGEVEITGEGHHHLALGNQYVRVFQVEVPARGATLMHWHRHDYVFVTLGVSNVENSVYGKMPVTLMLQDGEVRFAAGGFEHVARNLSDKPFRNVTIEFLKDAEAKKSPPAKWDEERGLHVFEGGTRDVMFVRDGVRVSEVELQPGTMLPRHHHAGPHLVVAVSDLELRSEVEGKGSAEIRQKAGDVVWLEGGFTHQLVNTGKQTAKFVALEFH